MAVPTKTSLILFTLLVLLCDYSNSFKLYNNYPVIELVEKAFKLKQGMKNLRSCVHVLHKTLNLVISLLQVTGEDQSAIAMTVETKTLTVGIV